MAGKAHVVIFVEGDTDKLLFDALMRYYRQQYSAGIASCEVRNLHGVSRYMSKVSGKLRNQIIPTVEKKGMAFSRMSPGLLRMMVFSVVSSV